MNPNQNPQSDLNQVKDVSLNNWSNPFDEQAKFGVKRLNILFLLLLS